MEHLPTGSLASNADTHLGAIHSQCRSIYDHTTLYIQSATKIERPPDVDVHPASTRHELR